MIIERDREDYSPVNQDPDLETSPARRLERRLSPRQKMESTPVWGHREDILAAYGNKDCIIVIGGTGSGKTTAIPFIVPGRGITTEPKRKVTEGLARFVAQIRGTRLGDEVAYQYRGSGRGLSDKAQMTFMTEGTLLSILLHNPTLSGFDYVALDEIQGETEDLNALGGILLKVQEKRRKTPGANPLKLIAMTATPNNLEALKQYFPNSEVVPVEGRMFHVEPHFLKEKEYVKPKDMARKAAETLFSQILRHEERKKERGNILTFMPGKAEIRATEKAIIDEFERIKNELIQELGEEVALRQLKEAGIADDSGSFALKIIPYHSQLSEEKLNEALSGSEERTILIATDVAETGLTLKNLQFVIDSGLVRQTEFNPSTGIERIKLVPCSKNSLLQRMGRAGRVREGDYFALFNEDNFESRPQAKVSEIERKNPMSFVMRLKKYGISSLDDIKLMARPPEQNLAYAIRMLKKWGALDSQERLTPLGDLMVEMGIEPRYAYLVAKGIENKCIGEAITIAAYLSATRAKPLFTGSKEEIALLLKEFQRGAKSDFQTILTFWEEYQKNKNNIEWPIRKILNQNALDDIEEIRDDLLKFFQENKIPFVTASNPQAIHRAITQTFLDRLFVLQKNGMYAALDGYMKGIRIDKETSALEGFLPPIILVGDENDQDVAQQVHQVDLHTIEELAPEYIKRVPLLARYDEEPDAVIQNIQVVLSGRVSYELEQKEQVPVEIRSAVGIFAQALAANRIRLPIVAENIYTINQINAAWRRREGQNASDHFNQQKLEAFYREHLAPFGIASKKDLERALASGKLNLTITMAEHLPQPYQPQAAKHPSQIHPITSQEPSESFLGRVRDRLIEFFRNFFEEPQVPQH
ncbi:ATP-dependent RNA helicase [Candidatus Gottesmanbacteria bacterium]|nr:ATP-dependent RNA helicase [Candidatus Gottesmanbacteria bacterium]